MMESTILGPKYLEYHQQKVWNLSYIPIKNCLAIYELDTNHVIPCQSKLFTLGAPSFYRIVSSERAHVLFIYFQQQQTQTNFQTKKRICSIEMLI